MQHVFLCQWQSVRLPTIDFHMQAVYEGESSPLLAALNIALLRVMQADMEESHAQGAAQVRGPVRVTTGSRVEPGFVTCVIDLPAQAVPYARLVGLGSGGAVLTTYPTYLNYLLCRLVLVAWPLCLTVASSSLPRCSRRHGHGDMTRAPGVHILTS